MLERIEKIFREVFDNESLQITEDFSPETYPDWDSFSQVKIAIGLEEEFGVKLTTEEMLEANSVKAIQILLRTKGVPD